MDVTGTAQDRLAVAEFRVPLEIIGLLTVTPPVGDGDKTPDIVRLDPKPWLAQKGVTFPAGASVAYVAATQRLLVRNTKGNLDRIEALLKQPTPAEQR